LLKEQIEREQQELEQLSALRLSVHMEETDSMIESTSNLRTHDSFDSTYDMTPTLLQLQQQQQASTISYGALDSDSIDDKDGLFRIRSNNNSDRQQSGDINPISVGLKHESIHKEHNIWHKWNFDTETVWQSIRNVFDRCFQPPVMGSIFGIIAAATPIRGYFVDLIDRRSHAPLQWMFDGLHTVGQTSVPINMMILGCNLSSSYSKGNMSVSSSSSGKDGMFSFQANMGIVIGKLIMLPFIGIATVYILKHYVLHIDDEIDGALYLVMMIVFICPTANNVMIMVELSGSNAKESIARVIAIQYAVAPIVLSVIMTIAIGVADSWS
jgi:predicted permease